MFSTQLGQRAANYIAARKTQEQGPTGDEVNARVSEAYDQFVADRAFDVRYNFDLR